LLTRDQLNPLAKQHTLGDWSVNLKFWGPKHFIFRNFIFPFVLGILFSLWFQHFSPSAQRVFSISCATSVCYSK
jgi:hypothetical protein